MEGSGESKVGGGMKMNKLDEIEAAIARFRKASLGKATICKSRLIF